MRATRRIAGAIGVRLAAALALLVLAACAGGRPPPDLGAPGRIPPSSATERGDDGLSYSRPPPLAQAAAQNADSLDSLPVTLFGRTERGWEIYMPMLAAEIGADPVPQGVAFARALLRWQVAHGLRADGVVTPETLKNLADTLQARRPFLQVRAAARSPLVRAANGGAAAPCPDPPDEATLAWTTPAESWGGRPNALRPGALAAWRRLRAAAARDGIVSPPSVLQVFSGYRSPAYDAGRCATEGNCDGLRRATCSAHRTGLAMDLVLDGVRPVDSTASADRLRLTRAPAYRWLLLNARRFGFVNYPFEPWHWEWTGEPVVSPYAVRPFATAATPPNAPAPPRPQPPTDDVQPGDLLPPELRGPSPR